MMNRNISRAAMLVAILTSVGAHAEPIGILDQDGGFVDLLNTRIITGSLVFPLNGPVRQEGTSIGPTATVFDNKEYSAMEVQLGNAGDQHESYLEFGGALGMSFSSSLANGAGDLEVGSAGFSGAGHALSRFNLTIKNNRSRAINMDFAFDIPGGELVTLDPALYPARDSRSSHARVQANIDAILKSPDPENEGTWLESTVGLFDFYADLQGAGARTCRIEDIATCDGKVIDYSSNVFPLLHERPITAGVSIFGFDIDPYSGLISLPEIPPFGELSIFYDLYSLAFGFREGGARALLGDPLDLFGGNGVRLIERYPAGTPGEVTSVSEPSTLALAGMGLMLVGWRLRRGRAGAAS